MDSLVSTLTECLRAIENSKHHLEPGFVSITGAKLVASEILKCAQTLIELEDARIQELKKNGPRLDCDGYGETTITLLRENECGVLKEKHYAFSCEHSLNIYRTDDEAVIARLRLHGPRDTDGWVNFIHAKHMWSSNINDIGLWISESESSYLRHQLLSSRSMSN